MTDDVGTSVVVPAHGRGRLTPFKKGVSGNPSGRPRQALDVAALAKENSVTAMKRIIKVIDSKDDRIALAAATQVLDRAIGKPTQTVEVDANVTHHGEEPVSDTVAWVRGVLGSRQNSQAEESLPN